MTEYDREEANAFRASILANPQDDAPRLAYSDWLDERGMEQLAAFIRWQVKGWRTRKEERDEHAAVFISETYVNGGYCCDAEFAEWFREHAEGVIARRTGWTWTWRRGFVDELSMPADDAVLDLGRMREVHPVTKVAVRGEPIGVAWNMLVEKFPTRMVLGHAAVVGVDGVVLLAEENCGPLWRTRLRAMYPKVKFKFLPNLAALDVTTVRWEEGGGLQMNFRLDIGAPILQPQGFVHGTVD